VWGKKKKTKNKQTKQKQYLTKPQIIFISKDIIHLKTYRQKLSSYSLKATCIHLLKAKYLPKEIYM